MTRTDVLVVGGGPAGSTAAAACRARGLDVIVLDRAHFPRDKVCAGWITPAVVDALDLDLADYASRRVLQPIHGFRIGVLGGRETTTRRQAAPVSYGIRRCEFDDYLLRRCGARLRLGEPLRELRRADGGWIANEEIFARAVVGAGGHFCPVARRLGAKVGRAETAVLAQEAEFPAAGGDVDGAVPELLFCPDLRGYGWVFRKGGYLNVGLGREDPLKLSEHVAAFREQMVREGRIPSDTPARFQGHAYRLYSHPPRRVVDDGVLLVGDAAGLAHARSGEGIRPAVESGLLAARTIARAARSNDLAADALEDYSVALRARFGERPRGEAGADRLAPLKRVLARGLLSQEWFARRVVVDRWFLQRHLAALGA